MLLIRSLHSAPQIAALAAGIVVTLNLTTAYAQDSSNAPRPADLQAAEQDLRREQAARDAATLQAQRAAQETESLQVSMISAAQRIQDRERALTEFELQLIELEDQRAQMAKDLASKDAQMRDVLLALQRLAVRPTDALMLQPLRPADAVRSGLVLSAAVPALTDYTGRLQKDLEVLYATRAAIIDRRANVASAAAELLDEQARLERLYAEKASLQKGFTQKAADAETRIATLAKEADDLRDLLDLVIADRKKQDAEAAEKTARDALILTPPDGAAPAPEIVAARRPTVPAAQRSFSKARGTLPFPVAGRLTQRYGENTESDARAKGIVITTRNAAQVVSPFDGVVAFAGAFRGYGKLLILEHSEGYHTLLAGMSRLDGAVGQRVLAGEPVGVMSPEGDPSLYVELRRDGQPINPLPWLAARTDDNSG